MHHHQLAIFPGQGSQSVGMSVEVLQNFPYTASVFEEAEDITKLPIKRLCSEGPEDELIQTTNQQPCILTTSYAIWQVLQKETNWRPTGFCGHSLGEYTALVASKRLTFSDAVGIVHKRAKFMQAAVPVGKGAMVAIKGSIDEGEISIICKKLADSTGMVLDVANYNSDQQTIISGHKEPVALAAEEFKKRGLTCIALPVSAPFHSSLMAPARQQMQAVLDQATLSPQESIIFPNLTAIPSAEYAIANLGAQIDHPVLWKQTLKNAFKYGFRMFVEVGPGSVLTSFNRTTLPRSEITMISSFPLEHGLLKLREIK